MNQAAELAHIIEKLRQFSDERDWEQFHTLKNLSMALSVEASELVELFQWSKPDEAYAEMDASRQQAVNDEVADVFLYLLRFCDKAGIDLYAAANSKMIKNAAKYPVPPKA